MKRKRLSMLLAIGMALGMTVCVHAEEPVEIHLANWRVEEIEAFEEINAAFMEEYPNIKPVYDAIVATEYDSKLSIDLNTKQAADIVYVRPFDRGRDLYEAGYLDFLDETSVPNLKDVASIQTDVYADEDGTIFAAPFMYINYGFMYNKNIFDELGLEEPETWDEFFACCDAIKEAGITPLAFGIKDTWILSACVSDSIFGAFVGGEEGRQKIINGEILPTSPELVDMYSTINRFVDYMPDNYDGIAYTDNVMLFAMGEAAIYPGGSFDVGYIESQGLDFEMGVFAPPVVNAGDTRYASMNGGAGLGLNADSEHKEEALTYINWLMGPKGQAMIGNGAPGLFPCSDAVNVADIDDPIIQEMVKFGGDDGSLYTIAMCMKLNAGDPTCTALSDENIFQMLTGAQTPEETAQKIEEGVAAWYAPWQK